MTVTVLKTYFKKQDPQIINYWDYKNFSNENYRQIVFDEVQTVQRSNESWSLNNCLNVCKRTLDIWALIKKRHLKKTTASSLTKQFCRQ